MEALARAAERKFAGVRLLQRHERSRNRHACPGATLIPNARGLSGHNLHTWTGGWGTVTYWNAFVAVNELHGKGTFFDERFDNAEQFPIAAKARLGQPSLPTTLKSRPNCRLCIFISWHYRR
jgi:hypothetical protein